MNLKDTLEELTPYLFFNDPSFRTKDSSFDSTNNLITSNFIHQVINKIDNYFYSEKYYGSNQEYLKDYEKHIIKSLIALLSTKPDSKSYDIIDNEFKKYTNDIFNRQNELNNFFSRFTKKIEEDLMKMPIEQSKFPGYYSLIQNQKDEEKLTQILDERVFHIENLKKYYSILCKYTKSYSFSLKHVSKTIDRFDKFLNCLCSFQNKVNDTNYSQIHFKYFRNIDSTDEKFIIYLIILHIKMRLFKMVNKIHDFLTILLQLIIIEQERPELKIDQEFSYEESINQIFPKPTIFRSTIEKNVSIDQILDFSFNYDSKNYFFLTKEGIFLKNFECNENDDKFGLNSPYFTKLNIIEDENLKIQEILSKCDKNEAKITYSNGNLFLFLAETKTIHKISIKKPNDQIKTEIIRIVIPDFPVISIGSFKNHFRIIQRKSYNDKKSTFLFTNVDLNSSSKNEPTQIEIKIDDKNENTKIKDILFANEFMFVCFEDSTLEQFSIMGNGRVEKINKIVLPFILTNYSIKIDDDLFLHNIEPVNYDGQFCVAFSSMYLPETKHWIRCENRIFIKYPFLHNFSSIVDNCTQFVLNRKLTREFTRENMTYKKENLLNNDEKTNKFELNVSPGEMASLFQDFVLIVSQLEGLKSLISNLKDDDLKRFFIVMMIKLSAINLVYETFKYPYNKEIKKQKKVMLESFKNFILDLFSMFPHSDSVNFEIMIQESVILTFLICGKFLFLPESINEIHEIFNQKLLNYETKIYSKNLLKSFSNILFSYPSSIYIIDKSIYNKLLEIRDEIDLYELFTKNIRFLIIESNYISKTINNESIQLIYPYIDVLFEYIDTIIDDESFSIKQIEMFLSYLFGLDLSNPFFSLKIEEKLIHISKKFYERIKKIPGIIENDKEFLQNNSGIENRQIQKTTKIIESDHPYDSKQTINKENGTIDFGEEADTILIQFDSRFEILENNLIKIFKGKNKKPAFQFKQNELNFNNFIKIDSNKVRIEISSKKEDYVNIKQNLWGYKITFIGIKYVNFDWKPNIHLNFYNYFISFLTQSFYSAYKSTKIENVEAEFKYILDNDIIQGIRIEDINYYEQVVLNSNSQLTEMKETEKNNNKQTIPIGNAISIQRGVSRGMSRGIGYDQQNDSNSILYSSVTKKMFLIGIIKAYENTDSSYSRFLNFMFEKTHSIKAINHVSKENQIIEDYFIACLMKQLGLISISIALDERIQTIKINEPIEFTIPKCLESLWKKVYRLRAKIRYQHQQFINNNTNNDDNSNPQIIFENYLKEIKTKCIILLYSDPILKLQNKDVEKVSESIYKFIVSPEPYSKYTNLINTRRQRLENSFKAISLLEDFIDSNLLFESSKLVFANFYNINQNNEKVYTKLNCRGLKESELEKYDNKYSSLCLKIIKNIFTQQSIGMICSTSFISELLFDHENNDIRIQCSEIIKNILENNNKSLFSNRINFTLILILICISLKTRNDDLIKYIIDILSNEKIDLESKQMILLVIPIFTQLKSDNLNIFDEDLLLSILDKGFKSPIIAKSVFRWIGKFLVFYPDNMTIKTDEYDFILKVFKGIGQSFVGKSCLFIDESFQPFAHRQVSEGMISFIRLLHNFKNNFLINAIHNILKVNLKNIKINEENDEIFSAIGLFASLGQPLSSFENERRITKSIFQDKDNNLAFENIIKYKKDNSYIYLDEFNNDCAYANSVLIDDANFNLSQTEISNILNLHELILNSEYFTKEPNYDVEISQKEITFNVLISTFYSFLPIVMQNKNNAYKIISRNVIDQTKSIFNLSQFLPPSNENSIVILSHFLEKAIFSPLYNSKSDDDKFIDSIRFIRLNYGEIIYGSENDVIKSDRNQFNLFIGNRPIASNLITFYKIKIKKIGSKRKLFFGFIDLEKFSYEQAFGFEFSNYFGRKSPYFMQKYADECNSELQIKEGDIIECFYTLDYCYLSINGNLAPYRIYHESLKAYSPVIYIINDEIELEILQNPTNIDSLNDKYGLLNINDNDDESKFFVEKDIILKPELIVKEKKNTQFLIGGTVFINQINFNEYDRNDKYYETLFKYRCRFGVIKDIYHLDDCNCISKLKIESYNYLTQSKELIEIDVDSRNVFPVQTSFFNIIENCANTKFGLNTSMDIKNIPIQSKLINIRNYLKNRTIRENSKSIAIIMTRYLVFILTDYYRFDPSQRILSENTSNPEISETVIKALASSLPTITLFQPEFNFSLDIVDLDYYLIFSNDVEKFIYKIPGLASCFSLSFKIFLKKSESFLSSHFSSKLLQVSYENASKQKQINCDSIYESIPFKYKIESFCPIQTQMNINENLLISDKNIGFIPILVNSIPDQLSSLIINQKNLRVSSNQVSYLATFKENKEISISWIFDIRALKDKKINKDKLFDLNDFRNYGLKCGLFIFSNYLNEELLKGPLGFIQTVFIIIQHIIDSEFLEDEYKAVVYKSILKNIFSLSLNKNVLVYPFLQPIIVAIASMGNFSDLFLNQEALKSFSSLIDTSNNLCQMNEFPTYENEIPLVFSLFSILIEEELNLQKIDKMMNKDDILSFFEKFYSINYKLFDINDVDNNGNNDDNYIEGRIVQNKIYDSQKILLSKKKAMNYRLFYLLYYYSILLKNDNNLPYPFFLFIHDRMKQNFGEFQIIITYDDIVKYKDNKNIIHSDKNILYESKEIKNENNLNCSFKIIKMSVDIMTMKGNLSSLNLISNDNTVKFKGINSDDSKFIIHQFEGNKFIEIPQNGEEVNVSFPIKILIMKNTRFGIRQGDYIVVNFHESKEKHREYFVNHFEDLRKEFQKFMSIKEYDSDLSKIILKNDEYAQTEIETSSSAVKFSQLKMNNQSDSKSDSNSLNFNKFSANNNQSSMKPFYYNKSSTINSSTFSFPNKTNNNSFSTKDTTNNNIQQFSFSNKTNNNIQQFSFSNKTNNNSSSKDTTNNNIQQFSFSNKTNDNSSSIKDTTNNNIQQFSFSNKTNNNSSTKDTTNNNIQQFSFPNKTNNNNSSSKDTTNNNIQQFSFSNKTINNIQQFSFSNKTNDNSSSIKDTTNNNIQQFSFSNKTNNNSSTKNTKNNKPFSLSNTSTSNFTDIKLHEGELIEIKTNSNITKTPENNSSDKSTTNLKPSPAVPIKSSPNLLSSEPAKFTRNPVQLGPFSSTPSTNITSLTRFGNSLFPRLTTATTSTAMTRASTTSFGGRVNNENISHTQSGRNEKRDDYLTYEMKKIPKTISAKIPTGLENDYILSLRISVLNSHSKLVEFVSALFSAVEEKQKLSVWNFSLPSRKKYQNIFLKQIFQPALSMNTESKFEIINQMLLTQKDERPTSSLTFNRIEQQRFFEKKSVKYRLLFIQFMDQIEISLLSSLIVHKGNPFIANLLNEGDVDSGGPGREIFACLMIELMNKHDCVFTFNPNRKIEGVDGLNQEDLIPNKFYKDESFMIENDPKRLSMYENRFIYAGALIAICFVSSLPQPLKLSMIIWEYLSKETVSIESIYEMDNEFKIIIQHAEFIYRQIEKDNVDDNDVIFSKTFEIKDSFGNSVELYKNGKEKHITKENLGEFITKAKEFRINEFKNELKDLKTGFNIIMKNDKITDILDPTELRLLICGEPTCKIDQMQKNIVIDFENKNLRNEEKEKMINMFWKVMSELDTKERLNFIRFSTCHTALPAPGLRWNKEMTVTILNKSIGAKDSLYAKTCSETVYIPSFSNEIELKEKIVKTCINNIDIISDLPPDYDFAEHFDDFE